MVNDARRSVTIVNGNFPPVPGVTGESASELAWFLENYAGCDVSIVTISSESRGVRPKPATGVVHELKCFSLGMKMLPSFVHSIIMGRALIRKAKKLDAEWTIVMTDPFLLSMWAALLMQSKGWILWSMDLYPEVLFASGQFSRKSIIGRKLLKWTYSSSPSAIIAFGPGQAQYLRSVYTTSAEMPVFELPCGLFLDEDAEKDELPEWGGAGKVTFGYVGEIGEAHDLEFVKEVARNLDPKRHQLIVSAYGKKMPELLSFISDFPVVKCVHSVSRSNLKFIDVHLATLESHWTHVCEPSKVFSAVCAGSTFILKADEGCDTWRLLKGAGVLVQNNPKSLKDVMGAIQEIDFKSFVNLARIRRMELLKAKALTFREIGDFLQG